MAFGKFVDSLFGGQQQPQPAQSEQPDAAAVFGAAPTQADADDARIARDLDALRASVRAAGRELPTVLSSRLAHIDDLLRVVISTIAAQSASTEQRVLLGAMVGDYLPTPLRAYLSLTHRDRDDESPATRQFATQLGLLEETVRDLLNQIRIGAIAELSTHGRFLVDKFTTPDDGLTLGAR